jgi:hypothetical protein
METEKSVTRIRIRLGLASWIRIRIEAKNWIRMRIHNTTNSFFHKPVGENIQYF